MRLYFALILCLFLSCLVSAQEESQTPYEIALQRIERANERNSLIVDLADLELDRLPPEIGQLRSARQLWLHDNQLTSLPPEIWQLENLVELTLFGNQLTELPPEIGQLSNLIVLRISDNHFSSLPATIFGLKLCFLDIRNNEFQELPNELSQVDFLNNPCGEYNHGFLVEGNPLTSPPPEVVEQGTAAILDYLRNPLLWYIRRYALYWAAATGGIITLLIAVRWRISRAKGKKKKGE